LFGPRWNGVEGHQFLLIVVSRVPPTKADLAVGKRDQAMVRNGDAMSVTAEIVEHVLGTTEGRLAIDDPVEQSLPSSLKARKRPNSVASLFQPDAHPNNARPLDFQAPDLQ
jgi:hypothetical protein